MPSHTTAAQDNAIDAATAHADEMHYHLETLEQVIDSLDDKITDLTEINDSLRSELDEANEKIAELERELSQRDA